MASKPLTVVVTLQAKPGQEARVREELTKLLVPTRAEEGCLNYDLHESASERGLFLFLENWANKADHERHLGQPHLQRWRELAKELLAKPRDLSLWQQVE